MEVALIGKGPGFEQAPLKGEGVTTWGVNDACGHRECDVVFWMDRCWEKDTQQDRVIRVSVNHTKTPMYSTQEWDDIPTSISYPLEEMTQYFGVDFFNDSCCYMLALAIHKKFKRISLWGFNYAWGDMYKEERPGVEFWLGVALTSGITLDLHGELSDLLRTNHQRHDPGCVYAYGTMQTMNRRGIKMGTFKPTEAKEFTFSHADRIAIIQILPQFGDYETLKGCKWLNENLWFNDEDRGKINLRQVKDDKGLPFYIWDDADIPILKIKLDVQAQCIIQTALETLNTEKTMRKAHFDLYEKFCIG